MATREMIKDQTDEERVSAVEDLKDETQQQSILFDAVAEKKLLRKCDLHVLPPVSFIFFLAFLDRTNIGTHLFPLPVRILISTK